MARICIAFAQDEDSEAAGWVGELAAFLTAEGHRVRPAVWEAPHESEFAVYNSAESQIADYVLLVCTSTSKLRVEEYLVGPWGASGYVRWMSERVDGEGPRLIPVLREGRDADDAIPPTLCSASWVDLRGPDFRRTGWRQLRDALVDATKVAVGAPLWQLRELVIRVEADRAEWTVRTGGAAGRLDRALRNHGFAALQRDASLGVPCDSRGVALTDVGASHLAELGARAEAIGERISAALPIACVDTLRAALGGRPSVVVRVVVSGPEASAVMELPWELMRIDGSFPVMTGRLHVVRELAAAEGEGFEAAQPLRVLAHIAAPEGVGVGTEEVAPLDLESAGWRIARALDPLGSAVRWTDLGTVDDLRAGVEAHRPSLLHFSGHGAPGSLMLEDDLGRPTPVRIGRAEETGSILHALDPSGAGLPASVWLSCCHGADGTADGNEPDAAMAFALHAQGVRQVIGYFGPLPDAVAARVDGALFAELIGSGDTWQAARRARRTAQDPVDGTVYPLAWASLVLYQRGAPLRFAPTQSVPTLDVPPTVRSCDLPGVDVADDGFIGRRRLLHHLRRAHTSGARTLGIYGLGGLGKTALAVRLAKLILRSAPGWARNVTVFTARDGSPSWDWVVPAVGALVPDAAAELAALDDLSPDERPAGLARALLDRVGDGVLLVDNVETLQDGADPLGVGPWRGSAVGEFLKALARPARATVIMTTRHRPDATDGEWVEITPCERSEVFRMLRWLPALRDAPSELRQELAERVQGHPRAIVLVHDIVRQALQDPDTPLLSSAESWRALIARILPGVERRIDADLALEHLIAGLTDEARAHLGECTAIGRPVPESVVSSLGNAGGKLISLGLLTKWAPRAEGPWAVHPFVLAAAERAGLAPTQSGRAILGRHWASAVRREGFDSLERVGGDPVTAMEAVRHFVAAAKWVDATRMLRAVHYQLGLRQWLEVRVRWMERLLELDWADPAAHGSVLHQLAGAYFQFGNHRDAEQAARLALESKRLARVEPGEVAATLVTLLNILLAQGRSAELAEVQAELDGLMATVPPRSPGEADRIAAMTHARAAAAYESGDYAEAERLSRESISLHEQAHGTRTHPRIFPPAALLGASLGGQEKWSESEQAFRDIIDRCRAIYGDRATMDSAVAWHGLGQALASQGLYEQALAAAYESVAANEAVLPGKGNSDLAKSRMGVGHVLGLLKRNAEAVEMYRDVIRELVPALGSRHPLVGQAVHQLAINLLALQHFEDAEPHYVECIAILESVPGTRYEAELRLARDGLGMCRSR